MQQNTTLRPRRETVVVLTLAVLFGGGAFFYLLLIGGGFFLSMLAALAVLAALGGLHYLFWGRTLERDVAEKRNPEDVWARREETLTTSRDLHSVKDSPRSPSANGTPLSPQRRQE